MRVVVDTNVLASAMIRRQGVTGQVLRYLLAKRQAISELDTQSIKSQAPE